MARRYKDAPSILQDEKECFLSGTLEGLERHHIYGGANRRNSAKYGLFTAATARNTAYGYGFGMTYTTSRPTECILTSTTTACYSG